MEFVRQHCVLLAGVFILWFGYGHLSEPTAAAADKMKLEPIGPRYLAIRPPEQPAARLEDPYRFTRLEDEPGQEASTAAGSSDDEEGMNLRTPSGSSEGSAGTSALPGNSSDGVASVRASSDVNPNGSPSGGSGKLPNPNVGKGGTKTNANGTPSGGSGKLPNPNSGKSRGSGRLPNPNGGAGSVSGSRNSSWAQAVGPPVFVVDAGPADLPPLEGPVRLWLGAVLDVAEGGSALISGSNVGIGQTVTGLDEAVPPVLIAIDGMTATVRYRTIEYTLGVDEPVLVIQPREDYEPVDAVPQEDGE